MFVSIGNHQHVEPTTAASLISTSSDGASLTAEGLLLYCQTQLDSLDGDINELMAHQKANLRRKDALAGAKTAMAKYKPPKTDAELEQVIAGIQSAIDKLPAGDPLRDLLLQEIDVLNTAYNKGGPIANMHTHQGGIHTAHVSFPTFGDESKSGATARTPLDPVWYEARIESFSNRYDEIKGNAELQMIELQSTLSARSTAIQLTTNMLAKLTQGDMAIVKNLG